MIRKNEQCTIDQTPAAKQFIFELNNSDQSHGLCPHQKIGRVTVETAFATRKTSAIIGKEIICICLDCNTKIKWVRGIIFLRPFPSIYALRKL